MRPVGVTLVGWYQILRGILSLLFGLSVLLFSSLAAWLPPGPPKAVPSNEFCANSGTPPAWPSSSLQSCTCSPDTECCIWRTGAAS